MISPICFTNFFHDFWSRFYIVILELVFFCQVTLFSVFYLDFYIHFLFRSLYSFSIWAFISLFYLKFYIPLLFRLSFPFSIWSFITLIYLDFYNPFIFGLFGSQIVLQWCKRKQFYQITSVIIRNDRVGWGKNHEN
jgi:hypothetical protein